VQVPLAWRLAERLRRSRRDREALLLEAVEASENERRRIAGDLHDAVVQDLAGISYSLSAAADGADTHSPGELRDTARAAATGTRDSIRRIRSLLVEIHPPNLRATGLEAALRDLLAPLAARGIETSLDVDSALDLSEQAERLVYRAAGEAVRNVERHAGAARISVRIANDDGRVRLEVEDDGTGFTAEERERRRADGHVGLSLLEEVAARMGGGLELESVPGTGTRLVLEVPAG
jgi:signal transduction histidine kinase